MKKLNLELGSIKNMLSKEQMKRLVGGYDTSWSVYCNYTDVSATVFYQCSAGGVGYPGTPASPPPGEVDNCVGKCYDDHPMANCHCYES